jgi:predicted O-methyltransferase YrrM
MHVAPLLIRLVQDRAVRHVLIIGAGDIEALVAVAHSLPDSGRLLAIEIDAIRVAAARAALDAARLTDRASVMHGDALRFLHKVAGPFDLAVLFPDPTLRPAAPADAPPLQARVRRLVPTPGPIVRVDDVTGCLQEVADETVAHRP